MTSQEAATNLCILFEDFCKTTNEDDKRRIATLAIGIAYTELSGIKDDRYMEIMKKLYPERCVIV